MEWGRVKLIPWWGWIILLCASCAALIVRVFVRKYRHRIDGFLAQDPRCTLCGGKLGRAEAARCVFGGEPPICRECAAEKVRLAERKARFLVVLAGAFEAFKIVHVVCKLRASEPLVWRDYLELAGGLFVLVGFLAHLRSLGERGPLHKELEAELRREQRAESEVE